MSSLADRVSNFAPARKILYFLIGAASWPVLAVRNKLRIIGAEHIRKLPAKNVLFVCNHHTYFFDVIAMIHVFSAVRWGRTETLGSPFYVLNPFARLSYVAADQTMKSSLLSRFFTLGGAILVKRTWNPTAGEKRKGLDPSDTRKITRALAKHWVINFPQGTTTPFAPGRKGTALIIKQSRPIVVPVVLSGFGEAFDKRSIGLRRKGTQLTVQVKEPLEIDYSARSEVILAQIMDAIEQSPRFSPHPEGNEPAPSPEPRA